MALPDIGMRQLLEAGVHFGHQKHRWDPRMEPYIFGVRSNIHILDLSQTVPLLHQAMVKVSEVAAKGGRILFVGTKRQASEVVATAAKRCAQYYVNHRWLGGTLTNWATISNSIRRLRVLEDMLSETAETGLTKKELMKLTRERDKLERSLGGIKDMGGLPDLMVIIDTTKEVIALGEARNLNIPVVAIIDSNSNPADADFPIPGNDDATRAIALYCDALADAVLDGMAGAQVDMGVDPGAAEDPVELALKTAPAKKNADDKKEAPAETKDDAVEKAKPVAEDKKAKPAKAALKAEKAAAPKAEKAAAPKVKAEPTTKPAAKAKAPAKKETAEKTAKPAAKKAETKAKPKTAAKPKAAPKEKAPAKAAKPKPKAETKVKPAKD